MSHELRTPLNSMLILAEQLAENPQGNLSARQVEFARTIHAAGPRPAHPHQRHPRPLQDRVGTVTVDVSEVHLRGARRVLDRAFRHMAEPRACDFRIEPVPELPPLFHTDAKRLQQSEEPAGQRLQVHGAGLGDRGGHAGRHGGRRGAVARPGSAAIVLAVTDTGIGIDPDKQQIIFEAFQQADGGTSRRYGGTGLGLAISREIARLLGGELRLKSRRGRQHVQLYLPEETVSGSSRRRPGSSWRGPNPPRRDRPPAAERAAVSVFDDRAYLSPATACCWWWRMTPPSRPCSRSWGGSAASR
jgi:signal transduction histidine kinase